MKGRICFFTSLMAIAPAFAADVQLPTLELKPNEVRSISAQRYEFSRVVIPEGAVLNVEPGGDALQLVVRGPMTLAGAIVARGFTEQEHQVAVAVPGQPPVMLAYRNTNRGGAGGDGGAAAGVNGGHGASASLDAGGGGGSGGGRFQDATGTHLYPGSSAVDDRGASGGPNCGGRGGDAGGRSVASSGGVVYLEIHGDFDGASGRIDVSGLPGQPGANGDHDVFPSSSYGCQGGSGGGGGGGPGGQGGYVVGYIKGKVTGYPQTVTVGGSGGSGGASPSTHQFGGRPGGRGQPGASGAVYWYPQQQR